jgi:hypothetical protein
MEASAGKLAELVGTRGAPAQPADPIRRLLVGGPGLKAERQRGFLRSLHGVPAHQPRDTRGRFKGTGALDGGVRPLPPPRPEGHDQLLGRPLAARQADRAR